MGQVQWSLGVAGNVQAQVCSVGGAIKVRAGEPGAVGRWHLWGGGGQLRTLGGPGPRGQRKEVAWTWPGDVATPKRLGPNVKCLLSVNQRGAHRDPASGWGLI